MNMPTFLLIGAGKSGTTSLNNYLKQHPEIFMSPVKEPQYFAFGDKALTFNGPGDPQLISRIPHNIQDYRSLFGGVTKQKAIGEASTANIYIPRASERIQKILPNAKLIAILRNPVERAYSNFLHQVRLGFEPLVDFTKALQAEEERIQRNWSYRFHYKKRGFYYGQLKAYFDRFHRDQMRICLFEDLVSNPVVLVQDIFRFLGVNDAFVPDTSRVHNSSMTPRSEALYRLVNRPNAVKAIINPVFPMKFRRLFANTINRFNLARPNCPAYAKVYLLKEYREDVLKLQDLIERDLAKWLEA